MFSNSAYYSRYINNPFKRFGSMNPTFNPYYKNNFYNKDFTYNNDKEPKLDDKNVSIDNQNNSENEINPNNSTSTENKTRGKDSKKFHINKDELSIFGFSIAIDDLIIVGVMILLLLQSDCDYVLVIILGLILLNIDFSSLNLF